MNQQMKRPVAAKDLEIHLPQGSVHNPAIPMRWCFSGDLLARMRAGIENGKGHRLLIVVQPAENYPSRYERRAVSDPAAGMHFVEFLKPGKWRIATLLIERPSFGGDALSSGTMLERMLMDNL